MNATAARRVADIAAHQDEYDDFKALGYVITAEHPCPARDRGDGTPFADGGPCGAPTIAPKEDGEIGYFCPACGMTSA